MSTEPVSFNPARRRVALTALVAVGLLVLACGSVGDVKSAIGAAATAAAINTIPGGELDGTPAAAAVSSAQCQTIGDAFLDFEGVYPYLGLASDEAYASNTPDSPTYINIPKVRADLAVLATLPGGTAGSLGGALTQIGQLVDLVESNIAAGGQPFSDGSDNGQKAMDLYLNLVGPYTTVAEAFSESCPNYAAATPAPEVAGFQIGQTASVGDLRVTLDSVAQPALETGPLPTAGNRFLLVHVTIENTGSETLQVTGFMETNLKDAAGNVYGFDPAASMLTAASADAGLDGDIPAGGTRSGLIGYQVPANAGDLLWIFHDFGQNQAIFAVNTGDIDTSAAGSDSDEDAARSDADATMTELFSLVATADAMDLTATASAP